LLSLIPSGAGDLVRELPEPAYLATNLGSAVVALFEFDHNDASGNVIREYFAATATTLYRNNGAGAWASVSAVGTLNGPIQAQSKDNLLHLCDGVNNWSYDGTTWFRTGFPIPQNAPQIDVSAGGSLVIQTNRYYWVTTADETAGRVHESSTSPISAGTGAITTKQTAVTPQPGTIQCTITSTAVVGTNTLFTKAVTDAGGSNGHPANGGGYTYKLYVNGLDFGTIASVTDDTHLTLVTPAPSNQTSTSLTGFAILPSRATNWHVYASEAENSKVGKYLATVVLPATVYTDNSAFLGLGGSLFLQIDRPIRNDPPVGSAIITTHKFRLWRRREKKPNFFNFTANEEVTSGTNGAASESCPGVDANTFSDTLDESSYPVQSNRIRAMASHGDALWIGTETTCLPLYGDSIDDFAISQITAFSVGIAGRNTMVTTPHGLAFLSYDRKLYLYPTANYPWAYVPKDVNVTSQLIEIGISNRKNLENLDPTQLDFSTVTFYNYGRRNWLVLSYFDKVNSTSGAPGFRTYVYDFEIKVWFELQRGFSSTAVFEVSAGNKVLVGGDSSGNTWVIDDLTGTFTSNANLPSALMRTALIDFKKPEIYHVFRAIEFEVDSAALANSITVNYYLDPINADSPGIPKKINMLPVDVGSNLFRGFPDDNDGGTLCRRLMIEISVASDTNSGAIRGLHVIADPAAGLI
jgi:hypothetical protein